MAAKKVRSIRCHDDAWEDLAIYAEDEVGDDTPSTLIELLIERYRASKPPIDPTRRKAYKDKRKKMEGTRIELAASALRTRRSRSVTRIVPVPKSFRSQRRMNKAA